MKKNKTIRLVFLQWQGGNNSDYYFGAELLQHIVPKANTTETFRIPVNSLFEEDLVIENGIRGKKALEEQLKMTKELLKKEKPSKIIVLGGDCSVSQAPFDYLKGIYGEKLGILWLDAHPDVATGENSNNLHEMVLSNLLGEGENAFSEKTENKFKSSEIMLAGLIYEELRDKDNNVKKLNINSLSPEELGATDEKLKKWLTANKLEYLAIHFDLDVLSPDDYRSIYPGEPYLETFGAAIGKLRLKDVSKVINEVSSVSEIVGFTIAEHLPWDAINLRNTLSQVSIFNE